MTEYKNLVKDFIERTQDNIKIIDREKLKENKESFEVTQLINSLLGLLVLPHEKRKSISDKYLSDIKTKDLVPENGWPSITIDIGKEKITNLKNLVFYLRNSVAHFGIDFIADDHENICGVSFTNLCPECKETVVFLCKMDMKDLRTFINKLSEVILDNITKTGVHA